MANIFEISEDLLATIAEIEENDGEVSKDLIEHLAIKQDELKDKIKSYSNVVKILENEQSLIKEEISRLKTLFDSKSKTIERLKAIMIKAVEQFGETTKNGGKYIDYGLGKVSVRNTEAIEVDESMINRFVNRYLTGLKWYEQTNQLSEEFIQDGDLLNYANNAGNDEMEEDIVIFTPKDLYNLKADINVNITLDELLTSRQGFNLAKALTEYGIFNVKAKADKTAIKKEAKSEEHYMPVFANLVQNQSLTIK